MVNCSTHVNVAGSAIIADKKVNFPAFLLELRCGV